MKELLAKQHEMEQNDLVHRLKLEQDEEVEKLRKVCRCFSSVNSTSRV